MVKQMLPAIRDVQQGGARSLRGIAQANITVIGNLAFQPRSTQLDGSRPQLSIVRVRPQLSSLGNSGVRIWRECRVGNRAA